MAEKNEKLATSEGKPIRNNKPKQSFELGILGLLTWLIPIIGAPSHNYWLSVGYQRFEI